MRILASTTLPNSIGTTFAAGVFIGYSEVKVDPSDLSTAHVYIKIPFFSSVTALGNGKQPIYVEDGSDNIIGAVTYALTEAEAQDWLDSVWDAVGDIHNTKTIAAIATATGKVPGDFSIVTG